MINTSELGAITPMLKYHISSGQFQCPPEPWFSLGTKRPHEVIHMT